MTHNDTSVGPSAYVRATFAAEMHRFECARGTRFGRPVLPLVCRIKAGSPATGGTTGVRLLAAATVTWPFTIATLTTGTLDPAAFRASSAPSGGSTSSLAFVSSR